MEESAQELSSVNVVLKQELAQHAPVPKVEKALEKSEAVEDKVQDASEKLVAVRSGRWRARSGTGTSFDHQLAAVKEKEEAARHAAFHDVLTGLPNRVLFNDRLEHGLAQAKRHGWTLAVMFVDLDSFKIINDTHGHDAGDSVLQTIAQRLMENTFATTTPSAALAAMNSCTC